MRSFLVLIGILFSFFFCVGSVSAYDYYVSPSGNDSNSGTQSLPFKTFSKALSVINAGDKLYVSGTYTVPLNITRSGTFESPISIIGLNYPKIIASGYANAINIKGNHVNVSGFEVSEAKSHVIITTSKYVHIENNIVHNGVKENGSNTQCGGSQFGSAIKVAVGGENILIKNNEVYENCGEGIATTRGFNVQIEGNTSRDNFSVNIYVDNSYNVKVIGNTSICTGINPKPDGTQAMGILLGNEFYEGWGSQLHDVLISGNVIKECSPIRLYNPISGQAGNFTIINNIFFNVPTPFVRIDGASNVVTSNNVAGTNNSTPLPLPTISPAPTFIYNIADLEPDGDVDGSDFNILVSNFGLAGVVGWIRSDIIKNGIVDIFDFNKLVSNWVL